MKKTLLLTISILTFIFAHAQSTGGNNIITGIVSDSISKQPLEYAPVTLYLKNKSKPLTGTVTDRNGNFKLAALQDGVFKVSVEFMGYQTFSLSNLILNKTNTSIELKQIALIPKKTDLENVTVVAHTKIVENKIDKMVYNAEKDITSQTGVAADVLKKVPQVSIDVDGNVELSGSSGVLFLINGKPSTVYGSNITDVLQSIPASQIKSIEVITNPGAKYDAEGLGGIINIILKNNNSKGYNGNISLTAGTLMENGSMNFNARKNQFGINTFISGNKRLLSKTPTTLDRLSNDSNIYSSLYQNGSSQFERHGLQTGIGFDWTYKKINSFSGTLSYNHFGYSSTGTLNQNSQTDLSNPATIILSMINNNNQFDFRNLDGSLNYKRIYTEENKDLEFSIHNSTGNSTNNSANQQFLMPQDSLFYGTSSTNPGKSQLTEIKIDFSQPLQKEVILGLGAKTTLYNILSNSNVLQFEQSQPNYVSNPTLDNNLRYHQQVYAAYTELSFPVSNWFKVKIGGRYERTEIQSFYSNAQTQVQVPGYNTIVPSIYFSKKLSENKTIKLSYSKRIERPDYWDLNLFINTNDPKNISAGNPHLQPEIGHRIELAFNTEIGKKGSAMATLFYRINDHDIQPYINYYSSYLVGDSMFYNVAVTTRQNIGMENNMGINLFADLNITTKLSLRANAIVFNRYTINTLDNGYNYNSFNYRFNMNSSYQFTKTIVAEFFGNFNSARHQAQGSYPSFTTYSFAIRKQFWDKKGSLALTANNFFNENINQKTILSGSGFSEHNTREIPFRSIGLNFAWKFGKLEFKKSKPEVDTNLNAPSEQ